VGVGYHADKEDFGEALELAIHVLQHQASTQEAKNLAMQLSDKLESYLTQEQIEAVKERARSKSLDELVRQVLVEM